MRKYYKHTIKNTVSIKRIYTFDTFLWEKNDEKSYSSSHNFWEFCYVRNGQIKYEYEDKKIVLFSGEAFLLPPQTNHIIINDSQIPAELLIINFDSSSQILSAIQEFCIKVDDYSNSIINSMIYEAQNTFDLKNINKLTPLNNAILGGEQCIEIYFELFLINIIRNLSQSNTPKILFREDTDKELICKKIISILKENIYEKLTIDKICKLTNYSRSYLSHVFNQITHKSIIPYFNELKIEEAKKLLISTDMTVAQISDKLSFSDVNYFNRRFKIQTKITPSDYKNNISKKNIKTFVIE